MRMCTDACLFSASGPDNVSGTSKYIHMYFPVFLLFGGRRREEERVCVGICMKHNYEEMGVKIESTYIFYEFMPKNHHNGDGLYVCKL